MPSPDDLAASPPIRRSPAARTVLVLGVFVGSCLSGVGLLTSDPRQPPLLPADAAARVNDRVISRALLDRVTNDVGAKRNVTIDEQLRRNVLEGLVDEELLVQRGIELGLPRVDRRVRAGLSRAAIERIVTTQASTPPDDAALQTFLTEHPELFAPAAKLRLRQIVFHIVGGDVDVARRRAEKAAARLRAGADFVTVRQQDGDTELAALPDTLLTRAKLLDYLGPTVVQAASSLPAGAYSEPVRTANAYHVVQVVERDTSGLPELARIRDQVLKEYQRRASDDGLRATLDHLRDEAEIAIND